MNEYLQEKVDEAIEQYNHELKRFKDSYKNPKTYKEAQDYAIVISNILNRIVRDFFKKDTFDNGEIYYSTAKDFIFPLLERAHEDIVDFSVLVQANMYKEIKVGLKPVRTEFNKDRALGIIKNLVSTSEVQND